MPPMAASGGSGPPPPPPPLPNLASSKSNGMDMSSLAAQLQAAKLKKSSPPKTQPAQQQPAENSGSSTSSGGSGNYGTIGESPLNCLDLLPSPSFSLLSCSISGSFSIIDFLKKTCLGRTTTGMASMMDEMAKTLARRRALTEKKEVRLHS